MELLLFTSWQQNWVILNANIDLTTWCVIKPISLQILNIYIFCSYLQKLVLILISYNLAIWQNVKTNLLFQLFVGFNIWCWCGWHSDFF